MNDTRPLMPPRDLARHDVAVRDELAAITQDIGPRSRPVGTLAPILPAQIFGAGVRIEPGRGEQCSYRGGIMLCRSAERPSPPSRGRYSGPDHLIPARGLTYQGGGEAARALSDRHRGRGWRRSRADGRCPFAPPAPARRPRAPAGPPWRRPQPSARICEWHRPDADRGIPRDTGRPPPERRQSTPPGP